MISARLATLSPPHMIKIQMKALSPHRPSTKISHHYEPDFFRSSIPTTPHGELYPCGLYTCKDLRPYILT
jgi:hypothetical protein